MEEFWDFYNLEPSDNVDQGWHLEGVLFVGLGVFAASSHRCRSTFPFVLDAYQLAFRGHVCWSFCIVAWDPYDLVHPEDR